MPPMTGSLTVVQPATSLASSRPTRATDEGGVAGMYVVSSALAVRPVLPHDTVRNVKQTNKMLICPRSLWPSNRAADNVP